jgi:hypothetical protein
MFVVMLGKTLWLTQNTKSFQMNALYQIGPLNVQPRNDSNVQLSTFCDRYSAGISRLANRAGWYADGDNIVV